MVCVAANSALARPEEAWDPSATTDVAADGARELWRKLPEKSHERQEDISVNAVVATVRACPLEVTSNALFLSSLLAVAVASHAHVKTWSRKIR